jgi:integrase
MPRVNLTVRKLQSLKGSPAGQVDYWDQSFPRFGVRVSPLGRKSWVVFYRYNGRARRLTLGTCPPTGLAKARELAQDALNKVRDGHDPARDQQLTRREGTFGELCNDYMKRHAVPNKKSWRQDQWLIDSQLLPHWRHVKARDIGTLDVLALVEAVADRGAKVLANRTLALISKIFAFAIPRGFRADHPCRGLSRPTKERGRDRVLSDEEIKTIWDTLESEDPFVRALFRLRFLTAQRGGEIRRMKWADIDLHRGEWVIPAAAAKNGVAHFVPLTEDAVTMLATLKHWQLDRLKTINEGRTKKRKEPKQFSEWVFPSPRGDDSPFDWEQKLTKRIRQKSGVDFRPHDIRRTVGTLLTKYCKAERFILKRILNHVDGDVTAIYDRNRYDEQKRLALDTWGRRLKAIVEEHESTETVVPISQGRK